MKMIGHDHFFYYLVSKSRCFFHRQKYESMQCVQLKKPICIND
jgi:hypothetical protein